VLCEKGTLKFHLNVLAYSHIKDLLMGSDCFSKNQIKQQYLEKKKYIYILIIYRPYANA